MQAFMESGAPMLILMVVVFYFLLIRPQQKRAKEHRELIGSLTRGDVVVTQGGLVGKVTKVDETEATVELAKDVRVQVIKQTIVEVRNRTSPAAANDAKSNKSSKADKADDESKD